MSNGKRAFRKLLRNKRAVAGMIVLLLYVIMAVFAPFVAGTDNPNEMDPYNMLSAPSGEHIFGTDDCGRDLWARVVYGTRYTFYVGIFTVSISMVLGTVLGLVAGFYGGAIDQIITSVTDAIWSLPTMVLGLAITAALGSGLINCIIAIGICFTPSFARVVRSMVLTVREQEYVQAARAIGLNDFEIITRYILPNVTPVIIVQASLNAAQAIITEASLSYLGLGIQPPNASWGYLLKTAQQYMGRAPWLSIFPGLMILLVVLSLNFMGDGLRDALDVRLKSE